MDHKHIKAQKLIFPSNLEFRTAENGLLVCNGTTKTVQVVPSLPIRESDNPPTDITIHGIGKYCFNLSDADVIIFSYANSQTQKTDCAIIEKDELISRLKPYHYDGDKINLKLILTDRGLHECLDFGEEGLYIALWLDDSRNFTQKICNWSLFS